MLVASYYAKQTYPECKKEQGQSEAVAFVHGYKKLLMKMNERKITIRLKIFTERKAFSCCYQVTSMAVFNELWILIVHTKKVLILK